MHSAANEFVELWKLAWERAFPDIVFGVLKEINWFISPKTIGKILIFLCKEFL